MSLSPKNDLGLKVKASLGHHFLTLLIADIDGGSTILLVIPPIQPIQPWFGVGHDVVNVN